MNPRLFAVPTIALAFTPVTVAAQTAQTTMNVSATVVEACVVTATNLVFGLYDPTTSTPVDAVSAITVTCTPGTVFSVGLNAGTTPGATITNRQMASGSERLGYGLFQDAARSVNWGNTPGTDTPAPGTAVLTPTVLTVYGRVPAQQAVAVGDYTDTVTITVSY